MSTTLEHSDNNESAVTTPVDCEARTRAAQRAFAAASYEQALAEINAIPVEQRTAELLRLYERARQMSETAVIRDKARHLLENGEYDLAIAQIEQIPELQRDAGVQALLKQARREAVSAAAYSAARVLCDEHRYAEAVAAMETIPVSARSVEIAGLLAESTKKNRLVDEVLAVLQPRWESLRCDPTAAKLRSVRSLVLQHIQLQPNDQQAQERLTIIDSSDYYLEQLKVVEAEYPVLHAEGRHREALKLLESIPEELRSDELTDRINSTSQLVAEVDDIGNSIIASVSTIDVKKWMEPLSRLEQLKTNPVDLLRSGLFESEFHLIIRSTVRQSLTDPEMATIFEQIIHGLNADEVCDLLNELDPDQVVSTPENQPALIARIHQIVECFDQTSLSTSEPQYRSIARFQQALPAIQQSLKLWQRFFDALEKYRDLHNRKWTRRDGLIENSVSAMLEDRARGLATAAAEVFPPGDDWATKLLDHLGAPSSRGCIPLKNAASKIRRFMKRGQWPTWSLTRFTRQKITRIAAGSFGVIAFGLGCKILYSLIFGLGGLVGSILALFVVSLWTFFCVLISRAV